MATSKFFCSRYGEFFFKKSQKSLCWIRQHFLFIYRQVAKIRQKKE
jgi:hypothetical protein